VTDGAARPEAAEHLPRTWFDRLYSALPLVTVFVALLALYAWEAARHASPWVFTDELELSQISRAIEATGHGARRGEPYFWQSLYTWLIAPAWAISSTSLAYAVAKYIGVITMTLSLVPTYLLARTIASPRAALFAAAGTASVPALAYGPMILEEPLSYPYAALAFFVIAVALVRRTPLWIAAAIGLAIVGGFVRGELGVLPIVLVLAAGLYALSSDAGRGWVSRFGTWDWIGVIVLGGGSVILFSGLVGKFSQSWAIATGFYRERMIDYGLNAAGSLTIGLGLLPVVAALSVLVRPRDEPASPERRAFRSLLFSSLIAFGVYTAVKASYLSTVFGTTVQERNLIYLVPLLFVGTALWLDRPRLRWVPLAAAVGLVAYLIVSTPYLLNNVPAVDSLGVAIAQMSNRELSFAHGGIEQALVIALVVSVALLVAPRFLAHRRPGWSAGVTATAALLVLAWCLAGQISAANYSNDASQTLITNYPRPLNWLDQLTHGKPTLYLGQHLDAGSDIGVWLTEFWNRSLRYVWSVDGSAPGPGPVETPNTAADGRLYPVPPGNVDYVLAEPGIDLDGTVVAGPKVTGRWFLYRVQKPLRYAYNETGVFADGQTGCSLAPCKQADSAYNRFGGQAGYAVVDVSRLSACGAPVGPAGVRVTIGKLIEGRDKQPHIGHVTKVERWTLRIGTARRFVLPTPKPPFRVEVQIAPTYAPLKFGGSDQRQLGGQVGFSFSRTPLGESLTSCGGAGSG
jgi:hypothetical protein